MYLNEQSSEEVPHKPVSPVTDVIADRIGLFAAAIVMVTSVVGSTLLACGGIFVLSFALIGAFWFAERMRGANAPPL